MGVPLIRHILAGPKKLNGRKERGSAVSFLSSLDSYRARCSILVGCGLNQYESTSPGHYLYHLLLPLEKRKRNTKKRAIEREAYKKERHGPAEVKDPEALFGRWAKIETPVLKRYVSSMSCVSSNF